MLKKNAWIDETAVPVQTSIKNARSGKFANRMEKALTKLDADKASCVELENHVIQESIEPVSLVLTKKRTHEEATIDSESEQEEPLTMVHSKDINSISQRELMKMVFADDKIAEDFEIEKQKEAERDLPKEKDDTLPGWGSWGGSGLSTKKRIVSITPGITSDQRKDAKLAHVLINEKQQKKSHKYLIPQVPHGFQNKDQYEKITRMPIGKEWNTQNSYRGFIKPRISVKLGTVIDPLSFQAIPRNTYRRK